MAIKLFKEIEVNIKERLCIMVDKKTVFEGYPIEVKYKMSKEQFDLCMDYEVIDERYFFETRVIELKSNQEVK